MADMRNRTSFYGAVPTSKLNADHVFMADGSTLQEQADKKFELIEEITLTEDAVLIERTAEPDGTSYNFIKIYVELQTATASTNRNSYVQTNNIPCVRLNGIPSTTARYASALRWIDGGLLFAANAASETSTADSSLGAYQTTAYMMRNITGNIENIKISCVDGIPADSIIKIYAVRA